MIRVKPLRWAPECPRGQRVYGRGTGFDGVEYAIVHYGGDVGDAIYRWAPPKGAWSEPFATYGEAKAAAQADYERRIMSALEPISASLETESAGHGEG